MSSTTISVNAVTANTSAVLHFAFVPLSITVGQTIVDNTTPAVIAGNSAVLSIDRVAQTITMNLNAAGAGVGASDSLTFTASDTLDEQTIYKTSIDTGFNWRVYSRYVAAAIADLAGTPSANVLAFCGALLSDRVPGSMLTQSILINATNRTNCLLDATTPGGKILDSDIDFVVSSDLPLIANSRNWS